jgi:hypothetical protein
MKSWWRICRQGKSWVASQNAYPWWLTSKG